MVDAVVSAALTKIDQPGADARAAALRTTAVLKAVASAGVKLAECAALLQRHSTGLEVADLAEVVAALHSAGCDGNDLAASVQELAGKRVGMSVMEPEGILNLVVAATKGTALGPVLPCGRGSNCKFPPRNLDT